MSDPRTAPYASARLAEIDTLAEVDPDSPDIIDGAFHLVRRHFDVQSFGVNGVTGNAGDEMVIEHHERDDVENRTNGHEELFAVMSGHAVFTVDGEEIDAPAGTLVFVRDPGCSAQPAQRPTAPRSSWSERVRACRTRSRAGRRTCRAAHFRCALVRHEAAVDQHVRAGHEAAFVGGQEDARAATSSGSPRRGHGVRA